MRISREMNEKGVCKISLDGRLDTTTSSFLREEIANLPDNTEKVILDFKNLTYI